MSHAYRSVQWTPFKRRYDAAIIVGIALFVAAFVLISKLTHRGGHALADEVILIRALAVCAFVMLHITLSIGPLARLDRRLLPLLYNRRHLGVMTFLVAAAHALLAVGYYHGFGQLSPIKSLLTSNVQYRSLAAFPFEILGLLALTILFLMAATSHDFWLKNLSPRVWKWLHMLVYIAWAAIVMHVALGALQSERSPLLAGMLLAGIVLVSALHLLAGRREARRDRASDAGVDLAELDELEDGRGKVIHLPGGESVALFRHGQRICAVGNVCAHQGGPIGEGRIIDGCITCPWHGYQYRPEDGRSPPPFTERLPAYRTRIVDGRVVIEAAENDRVS